MDFEDLGEEPKQYVKKAFAITEYGYDKNGNVTEVKLPEGGRILREYDVCDRMVKETLSDEANGIWKVGLLTLFKTKVIRF